MPKLNLSQQYIYAGRKFGPGETDVPEKAVESLTQKEKAYNDRLRTHEAPAPVTPGLAAGERHDPRRLPRPQDVPAGALAPSPGAVAAGAESATQTDPNARQPVDESASDKGGKSAAVRAATHADTKGDKK